ncbi:MAG: DUF58 domain-containing protein [Planctomycetota bacterium]|nr:DUF58 domain-containing protein [Planctomycetota bacterium]
MVTSPSSPTPPSMRFVDPPGLARIARLELVARTAVEGLLSGLHPSPFFGSSVEYADHRPYTQSDELRNVDWKQLAKTDKLFVKLFEEQTNTRITVILDTSKSMDFSGTDGGITKLDYGRFLAAGLCHLALKQNDAAGLATFDSQMRAYVPPRSIPRHFRNVLAALDSTAPGPETQVGTALRELAGRVPKRGIVVLISDLLDDPGAIGTALALLKHQRHDLVVFHLIDPAERDFPWEKTTQFRDTEGEGRLVANPRAVRAAYLERFAAFRATLQSACFERRIGYECIDTSQPYDHVLAAYLARRARLTG